MGEVINMRQEYAMSINKQYLEYLGITSVSEDGKEIIMNGKKTLKQYFDGKYYSILLYDPIRRQAVPKELRTNATGEFTLGVHRVVYAWFNGFIPTGLVVDHINNNKQDNHKDNLQLLTPQQNIFKARKVKEMKVYPLPKKKTITLEQCKQLLEECVANYEQAKLNKEPELAKKYRTYKVRYESWLEQLKVRSFE